MAEEIFYSDGTFNVIRFMTGFPVEQVRLGRGYSLVLRYMIELNGHFVGPIVFLDLPALANQTVSTFTRFYIDVYGDFDNTCDFYRDILDTRITHENLDVFIKRVLGGFEEFLKLKKRYESVTTSIGRITVTRNTALNNVVEF